MRQFMIASHIHDIMFGETVPIGTIYGKYAGNYYILINPDKDGLNTLNLKKGTLPVVVYYKRSNGYYQRAIWRLRTDNPMYKMLEKRFPDQAPKLRWSEPKHDTDNDIDFNKLMLDTGAPLKKKSRALAEESSRQASRKTLKRTKSSKKTPVFYDKGKNHITDYSCDKNDQYKFHPGYENREPKNKK